MNGADAQSPPESALLRAVQRHERKWIVVWLAGCAAVVALLVVGTVLTTGAERAVDAWNSRWIAQIDAAQSLVRAERYLEALPELERLDREFPATFIKHRFDKERERLLALLGDTYVGLEKRGKAIDTFTRLVAFDPKNYDNHFRLAEAHRHFNDVDEARLAYAAVLAIHPTHLPSLKARAETGFSAGLYAAIVEDYEHYLDAYLLARARLSIGEHAVELQLPVDGREHEVEAVFELPENWSGAPCLETRGYSARLGAIELVPPLRVGVVEECAPVTIVAGSGWSASDGVWLDGELAASAPGSRVCGPAVQIPRGAARVRAKLTLFKALPKEVWPLVVKSYRNRLELERLPAAERRSRVGGCLEAGSLFADE